MSFFMSVRNSLTIGFTVALLEEVSSAETKRVELKSMEAKLPRTSSERLIVFCLIGFTLVKIFYKTAIHKVY